MKVPLKVYIKFFLFLGIGFGLSMFLMDYLFDGKISILRNVFSGTFFGLFMSYVTIEGQKNGLQKLGITSWSKDDFKVHQSITIPNSISINEIFNLLKNNAKTAKWKLQLEEDVIVGKTKISFYSFGEKITIRDWNDMIHIESKPLLPTILLDGAKNKENVLLVQNLLENRPSLSEPDFSY